MHKPRNGRLIKAFVDGDKEGVCQGAVGPAGPASLHNVPVCFIE